MQAEQLLTVAVLPCLSVMFITQCSGDLPERKTDITKMFICFTDSKLLIELSLN